MDAVIEVGGAGSQDGVDYLFAAIRPSQTYGLVWLDFNNDGEVNFGEQAIEGVDLELTGFDDRGQPVSLTATTDAKGVALCQLRLRNKDPLGTYVVTATTAGGTPASASSTFSVR